jgi:hypothetical protein
MVPADHAHLFQRLVDYQAEFEQDHVMLRWGSLTL